MSVAVAKIVGRQIVNMGWSKISCVKLSVRKSS